MTQMLKLGYSPCPNDTFIFHALAHGLIPLPEEIGLEIRLADVETLNQAAKTGRFEITKLSFAALGHLRDKYGLLRSGAALGRGCGPLIVAKPGFDPERLQEIGIAVPGHWTTANLLLHLYLSGNVRPVPLVFDRIMPAVSAGEYEAGVIIHEGRFTFRDHGLVSLADLGEWWEKMTGLPIPLGGIAMRRDLGPDTAKAVERAIRKSVRYAFDHGEAAREYIRAHAQEMSESVIGRHIELYVNEFTLDLGKEGQRAVDALFSMGAAKGIIPKSHAPLFAGG